MSHILHRIEDAIGHTPLLELDGLEKHDNLDAHILVKLESVNPFGSLKDRIAMAMIDDLEQNTDIQPGDTLVEFSSGNTAIALAAIAAKRGYKMLCYIMQSTPERVRLLEAYGAEVHEMADMDPAFLQTMMAMGDEGDSTELVSQYFAELGKKDGKRYFPTNQASNDANRRIQYSTTGQEIIEDAGHVDVFLGGIGSGGSITGISQALHEKFPDVETIAFEPTDDDPEGLNGIHSIHLTPKSQFSQLVLRSKECPYSRIEQVSPEEAYRAANKVARTDGIFLGVTSGAAIALAERLARQPDYQGKTIVTLGYDDVMKYLSSPEVDPKYAEAE